MLSLPSAKCRTVSPLAVSNGAVRASRFRPTAEDGLASSNFGASGGRFAPRNTAELVTILIFAWIGRLPQEKALEMTRQHCAGLAAAPTNISATAISVSKLAFHAKVWRFPCNSFLLFDLK